ncbi:hypothetical protein CEP51_015891 [Fusarium floridanum]|uniref:PPPDE domain-containing protein n=1 Tax=Fusarium floridanum TaxID=1325733 RepID=A0A428P121_9HYPO|nr:hypothetical protein CEP51_015891 [Fusarium floridanum]
MPGETKYKIYVAVHKGDPVDFSKFRHTGLWCVPEDGSSHYYFHVKGLTGAFAFERRKNFDPTTSRTFAKKVRVGKTRHPLTSSELSRQMESVDVLNYDAEFNCQQWVDFALRTLYHAGYLTGEQYDTGLNGMIDATMEAEDEMLA